MEVESRIRPPAALLSEGLACHRQRKLFQAEKHYRAVLAVVPDHPEALHLLGVIALERGEPQRGAELLGRAVALQPNAPAFRANLSEALRQSGQVGPALEHAAAAVSLAPANADFHNTLGLALSALGRWGEAARHFREASRLRPNFALAHSNHGIALRELGRDDLALAAFRQAVACAPELPSARSHLGQLLLEQHQAGEALIHCREAVRLAPDSVEPLNNLGNVLRQLGRLDEARDFYQRVLRLQPGQAMAHNNLGQALQEEGRLDEALVCYRRALEGEPNSARFLCNLASLLAEMEQDDEALRLCRAALEHEPRYAEGWHLLGNLLAERGDLDGAEAGYREALRLKPHATTALVSLGHLWEQRGELEAGRACFRAAVRQDPHQSGALAALAVSLRGRLPLDELTAGLRLLEAPLPAASRARLQYGLSQALDGLGRYAEAAQLLRQANAQRSTHLARSGRGYDPDVHERFVHRICAAFAPAFFERVRGWGLDDPAPVFVVGLPRSGTTLTEQLLAGHPRVFGAGELPDVRRTFELLPRLLGSDAAPEECVERYAQPALRQAAEDHLRRLRALSAAAERVVDKMPDNYLHLGLIAALFPQARIIHVRRDVRDVALSCWMTDFKDIGWACDLGHIARRIAAYQRVMEHWRRVLPIPVLEVDYEEMVRDLDAHARRLVAFCGLEWDPACLEFHQAKRPVRTASAIQVREPVYARSVGRWRHYADDLAPVLQLLGSNPRPRDGSVADLR